jgi:excisionase family DNA binding protein
MTGGNSSDPHGTRDTGAGRSHDTVDEHATAYSSGTRTTRVTITGPRLYTPTEAAALLRVRESWLRRQAGLRRIPSTYLGKHLRFSEDDLRAVIAAGSRARARRRRRA